MSSDEGMCILFCQLLYFGNNFKQIMKLIFFIFKRINILPQKSYFSVPIIYCILSFFLMSSTLLLRSLPLVKGTIQKVQNLSQPLIIEIHAFIPSFLFGKRPIYFISRKSSVNNTLLVDCGSFRIFGSFL